MRMLAVNAGSTSMKVSLLDGDQLLAKATTLDEALRWDTAGVEVVVHRVVHGRSRDRPALIDDDLLGELRDLCDLAPLYQPPAIEAIERCREALPMPQYACFDTSFHTTIPPAANTYALPLRLREQVRVYGFHGLAHSWVAQRVCRLAPEVRRLVVAHLGGGESLCAVLDGRSIATTMGFTPVDGLVMATRSGLVDPGAISWLASHTDEDLDQVLSNESGLLGLCGSSDLRDVLRRREHGDADAAVAFDVYLHRLVTLLGGCVAALEGVDAIAFSGGIGEHSAEVRRAVAERMAWLGMSIGGSAEEEITSPGATVRTFVVEAREDLAMAGQVSILLATGR